MMGMLGMDDNSSDDILAELEKELIDSPKQPPRSAELVASTSRRGSRGSEDDILAELETELGGSPAGSTQAAGRVAPKFRGSTQKRDKVDTSEVRQRLASLAGVALSPAIDGIAPPSHAVDIGRVNGGAAGRGTGAVAAQPQNGGDARRPEAHDASDGSDTWHKSDYESLRSFRAAMPSLSEQGPLVGGALAGGGALSPSYASLERDLSLTGSGGAGAAQEGAGAPLAPGEARRVLARLAGGGGAQETGPGAGGAGGGGGGGGRLRGGGGGGAPGRGRSRLQGSC